VFSLVLDVAGRRSDAGLVFMMYRRGWMRLPKLDYARPDRVPGDPDFNRPQYRREDWAFLWILLIIGVTGYVLKRQGWFGCRARGRLGHRWWSPWARCWRRHARPGLGEHGGGLLRHGFVVVSGLIALILIALIPFTKVKHIFSRRPRWMVRRSAGIARFAPSSRLSGTSGRREITDFNWKQLLNLDACTSAAAAMEPARPRVSAHRCRRAT